MKRSLKYILNNKKRICKDCGVEFIPRALNSFRCIECQKIAKQKTIKKAKLKYRSNPENREKESLYMKNKRLNPEYLEMEKKWKSKEEYKQKQCEYEKRRRLQGIDWVSLNPKKYKLYMKKYYQDNKKKHLKRSREYSQKHPEYAKRSKLRRRAKEKELNISLPSIDIIQQRMNLFNGCCYCGKDDLTLEHLIPINNYGTNAVFNLFGACKSCNSSKQDKQFLRWYRDQIFYDPIKEYNILQNTLVG